MKETLMVYGTRFGATPEACAVIQKILEKEYNQHVEIWNLENWHSCPDLNDYDNIIIGSGIKHSEWTENAKKYLGSDFGDKKVAVFISSIYAGEEEHYEHAYEKFLKSVIEEYPNLKPVAIAAFGGRIPKEEIPNIAPSSVLIRLPENQHDNRNWVIIEEWAHKIGKLFRD
ncbi:MAG: flavodoxin domain-containing protein [Candidatus Heimdallarchaeaceae archaeon]